MSRRGEPTDRDAFVALWIEETACHTLPIAEGFRLARHARLCDAVELMQRAKAAQTHAVNMCNREVNAREYARHSNNKKHIEDLCEKYGFAVTIGGDPRGYVVKVRFPSGAYNTMGGAEEGYGVPS